MSDFDSRFSVDIKEESSHFYAPTLATAMTSGIMFSASVSRSGEHRISAVPWGDFYTVWQKYPLRFKDKLTEFGGQMSMCPHNVQFLAEPE